MQKRTLLILAILSFAIALLVFVFGVLRVHASDDRCAFWDTFTGGQRFDYRVDNGRWNLPDDVQISATMTFPKTALWKYYSAKENQSYVIFFLSLEPAGVPVGQHDICVDVLAGMGMDQ